MLRIYTYKGCGTCRKARVWLEGRGVAFEEVAIREVPPGTELIRGMVAARGGNRAAVCNTSGGDYREMQLGAKLAGMGEREFLELLSGNGNLIRRPFAVDEAAGVWLVGFKEAEWAAAFPG